jgi:O-antigen/teichoic acid export membrane protein
VVQSLVPTAGVVISLLAVQAAGVAVWGGFVAAMAVVRLWAQIVNFGARDLLVRRFSLDPARIAEVWQRNLSARLWLAVPAPLVFLALGASPQRTVLMTVWTLAIVVGQSHDALISYRRAFAFGVAVELLAVGLTCAGIVALGGGLTADHLIAVSAVAAILRAAILAARFRVLSWRLLGRPSGAELHASLPFFALTFSGAVQSRIDLYVVAALLPAAAIGEYALLTNFVLLGQSVAVALVAPVVPSLYRLARPSVILASARLLAIGVPLSLAAAAATWVLIRSLYGVSLPSLPIVAAWSAMLPCYLYLPLVYLAFRAGRERAVLGANVLGIVVGLVGAVLLARPLGIGGAMLAAAAAQVAIAAVHVALTIRGPADGAAAATAATPGISPPVRGRAAIGGDG